MKGKAKIKRVKKPKTHKMPDGSTMSGSKHSTKSKIVRTAKREGY
jgi:hypothetical protein